jgi:uroporphyrin-III C-methyltransferase
MIGKVYLVGAGPGDPELITVKGLKALQQADVVIYDRLAPSALLSFARPAAELIDAGKQPQQHRLDQAHINALLIEKAQAGKIVVRLKGGDPFVFGRGGEEALACYAAQVPFEVIPGISSAIAVPAYAGVPVTQRGITAAFTVISAHEDPESDANRLNYAALAQVGGTLVILMGVKHLPALTEKLLDAGLAAATPALGIEWGTTPQQRTVSATLATIAHAAADLQPPTITVIGQVVTLRELGLDWFQP